MWGQVIDTEGRRPTLELVQGVFVSDPALTQMEVSSTGLLQPVPPVLLPSWHTHFLAVLLSWEHLWLGPSPTQSVQDPWGPPQGSQSEQRSLQGGAAGRSQRLISFSSRVRLAPRAGRPLERGA